MKTKSLIGLLALLVLVIAACGGAAGSTDANVDAGAPAGVDSSQVEAQDNAVMDDMSSSDMSGDDMSSDDMPSDDMSNDDISSDDMSSDDMSNDDMSSDDMSSDDMSSDDMSNDDVSDNDMSNDDMAGDDMSGDDMSDDDMSGDDMSDDDMSGDMMELPTWFSAELTDVTTGETFAISDFEGKVVLVETIAIWCSSCERQQREVLALHEALGKRDDLVTVALDIDPNEDADSLKAYADRRGFDWHYAVAPRDVAREIGQLYGDQFLNPPSTPILIFDRHGEPHPLPFGLKSAEELEEALAPFLDGEM